MKIQKSESKPRCGSNRVSRGVAIGGGGAIATSIVYLPLRLPSRSWYPPLSDGNQDYWLAKGWGGRDCYHSYFSHFYVREDLLKHLCQCPPVDPWTRAKNLDQLYSSINHHRVDNNKPNLLYLCIHIQKTKRSCRYYYGDEDLGAENSEKERE